MIIEARRVLADYWVPADHPAPETVRHRLDDVARKLLPTALESILERVFPEDDATVWMVRRMNLDLNLDLELDDERLASAWAARASEVLTRKLADGSDPDVVRFENPADMRARFVFETVAGGSARSWYFAPFEGLGMLPASAAIRTAVVEDAATGMEALRRLSTSELSRVISALSEADAGTILQRLRASADSEAFHLASLVAAWQSMGHSISGESRVALALIVEAGRPDTLPGDSDLSRARSVARLAKLIRELPPARGSRMVQDLSLGDITRLYVILGPEEARTLAPLAGAPIEVLGKLLPSGTQHVPEPDRKYTPFGGIFLLLPILDDLPFDSNFDAPAMARLWVLSKCLGQPRAYPLFLDSLTRELLGIDPDLPVAAFVRWQKRVSPESLTGWVETIRQADLARDNWSVDRPGDTDYLQLPKTLRASRAKDDVMAQAARLVLRNFSWRLPGFSGASFRHLFDNFLDFPASIEELPARRIVRLGRPPLGLVLNLIGMSRSSYRCSWLDSRTFELYPEN